MRGRPFRKGESGNPGGRPRVSSNIRDLARQHAPAAIAELARLTLRARSEGVRVAAIKELLDRGFGRSTQIVEGSLDRGSIPTELPLVQFIFSDDGDRTNEG